jgi:hypothetical protein
MEPLQILTCFGQQMTLNFSPIKFTYAHYFGTDPQKAIN